MTIRVTVLNDGEKFCTLVDGELNFWVVVAGIPTSVQDSELMRVTEWNLEQDIPPNLEVAYEGGSPNHTDMFWYHLRAPEVDHEVLMTPKAARWLKDTYGGITK